MHDCHPPIDESASRDARRPEPSGPAVHLETFGCQMNELDSELVRGQLQALGYHFVEDREAADVLLLNTCSVREQAENKALSRIGEMGVRKRDGERLVIGVIGCMAEREGERMMVRHPQVDVMCGPGELDKLPMLLDNAMKAEAVHRADRIALQGSTARRSSTLEAAEDSLELLDLSRAFDPDRAEAGGRSAYVRITRGCNKFCTYCVVPHTRGPEIHRPPDSIVAECRALADAGVIEVTLLGQTVNHYRYTHGVAITVGGGEAPQVGPGLGAFRSSGGGAGEAAASRATAANTASRGATRTTSFADLLHRIHEEVPAIQRLRFVTSYPRDFGDDALQVMAESPRICRYLHVPAQSGSDVMLRRMNRGYTRSQYLEFIHRARTFMPDVSIAGDIIVGFSGETDEDHEATRTLMREVGFKNNFIFKYSPRPGTTAFDRLPDDVPLEVKRWRNNDLLALQAEVSTAVHAERVGRTELVFVEKLSRRSAARTGNVELRWAADRIQMSGRTGGDLITVFDLPGGMRPEEMIGRIVPVRVTASGPLLLHGELVDAGLPSEARTDVAGHV